MKKTAKKVLCLIVIAVLAFLLFETVLILTNDRAQQSFQQGWEDAMSETAAYQDPQK